MKWNDKTKRTLLVILCVLVGIILVLGISSQLQKPKPKEDVLPEREETVQEIQVELSEEEHAGVIEGNAGKESQDEIVEERVPVQTDEEGQVIQSTPQKPEVEEEALTDPTETPDGKVQETKPETLAHEAVPSTEELKELAEEPRSEGGNDGQIYVPGFGWMQDIGNAQGGTAGDMVENGNKIGIME